MADEAQPTPISLFLHAAVDREIWDLGLGRTEAEARAALIARLSDGEPMDGGAVDPETTIAEFGVALVIRGDRADIARFVSALRVPADLPAWLSTSN